MVAPGAGVAAEVLADGPICVMFANDSGTVICAKLASLGLSNHHAK